MRAVGRCRGGGPGRHRRRDLAPQAHANRLLRREAGTPSRLLVQLVRRPHRRGPDGLAGHRRPGPALPLLRRQRLAGHRPAHRRVRRAGLRPRVARLLADADWAYFYTPYDADDPVASPGQLRGGHWTDDNTSPRTGTARSTPSRAWRATSGSPTAPSRPSTTGTPSAPCSPSGSRSRRRRARGSPSTACGCGRATTRTGGAN